MTIVNIFKRPFDFHKTFKILQLKIWFIYVIYYILYFNTVLNLYIRIMDVNLYKNKQNLTPLAV